MHENLFWQRAMECAQPHDLRRILMSFACGPRFGGMVVFFHLPAKQPYCLLPMCFVVRPSPTFDGALLFKPEQGGRCPSSEVETYGGPMARRLYCW